MTQKYNVQAWFWKLKINKNSERTHMTWAIYSLNEKIYMNEYLGLLKIQKFLSTVEHPIYLTNWPFQLSFVKIAVFWN